MTSGRNPWGGDDGAEHDEAERPPAPSDKERPPHNPWLTPQDDAAQRRSARIEDILRARPARRAGLPVPSRQARRLLVLAGIAAAASALAASAVHVLGQGERGLVLTLGRHTRDIGPGVALTLPWPIETVLTVPTGAIQSLALPGGDDENLMLTRDRQLIDIAFQLRWKIADPAAFAFALKDPRAALRNLADAEMRAAVGEMPFDPLWDGSQRKMAADRAAKRMQAVLDGWHAGVRIEGVEIVRANPPGQLADAFAKITQARSEAEENRQKAEDWAARTINNANAEAQDFDHIYQQYRAAPDITRKRMYYETMERIISNTDRVIVGGSGAAAVPAAPAKAAPAAPGPAQEK